MAAAGAADGSYRLGNLSVEVREGVARLPGTGTIAASTATLASSLRFAVGVASIPLHEALRSMTATPAAMLGLDRVGSLEPGAWADLVVLSDDLDVRRVMRRGSWIS
jgi:N-acetylglucosamine-6-phosphate deacetylase